MASKTKQRPTIQSLRELRMYPLQLARLLWPQVRLSQEQQEIVKSVWFDDETFVVAGNQLGKDFIAGMITMMFFLTRTPCRIVTTSVRDRHLDILWGEINWFVQNCAFPLDFRKGGPLVIRHRKITKIKSDGQQCPLSYIVGLVLGEGEGMQGHHGGDKTYDLEEYGDASLDELGSYVSEENSICSRHGIAGNPVDDASTLIIGDEASGLDDQVYTMSRSWAHRKLFIGNAWDCESFFRWAFEGTPDGRIPAGDIPRENGDRYRRRVIRIQADRSPNVRLALIQLSKGQEPTGQVLVKGVKTWDQYQWDLKTLSPQEKSVILDAEWYSGAGTRLVPMGWLDLAQDLGDRLLPTLPEVGVAMGVDSAMGGDNTTWVVLGRTCLLHLQSERTVDTARIVDVTLDLMHRFRVPADKVMFDQGGGGRQHADQLRRQGYDVQLVWFGESVNPPIKHGTTQVRHRREQREQRHVYKNRRAQMYDMARQLLEPEMDGKEPVARYGLPGEFLNLQRIDGGPSLRAQLAIMPYDFDEEGRMFLPPKRQHPDSKQKKRTLSQMLGCSPDEADAFVMAVYAMNRKTLKSRAGVM